MSNLKATPAELTSGAERVDREKDALAAILGQVRGKVEGSSSVWASDSSAQFVLLMQKYDDASNKLHTSLTEIADNLRANARGYDTTEVANVDAVKSVNSLLNL
ncbi:WXG100 family type VII secretion target [Antrihabitans stalactiti]|uniref:ESAT-6-like protein n=1 Tax=Antrihabitans stalactiti TaxID=2584121 RepID=A0A848KES2_9NOCA|nr:WXG100 family type VII secretion target [Antrihabitans stalactiti]NMN96236.1 WXG100 family type VII secretion target [Antrihabitans stalactiti]